MIAGMNDRQADAEARRKEEQREASERPAAPTEMKKRKRANMHDGIGVWCDCCSCEAEPRWVAVAEELGIDLSDYEDEDTESQDMSGG
jgi:hypothetical protein